MSARTASSLFVPFEKVRSKENGMIYLHVHKRCFCLVFGTQILTHHLVPLRAPDDSRPCLSYVCSTCDTTFSRPEYLEFHERMHTRAGERVFKCPDCDTWFASLIHDFGIGRRCIRPQRRLRGLKMLEKALQVILLKIQGEPILRTD